MGLLVFRHLKGTKSERAAKSVQETSSSPGTRRAFVFALVASMISGYLSLSQEIVWYRVFSYTSGGDPNTFAYVIGVFLLFVAIGALLGGTVLTRQRP